MEIALVNQTTQLRRIASPTVAPVWCRVILSTCIGLMLPGLVGCQKSQPYMLGSSVPSYLKPYQPGAPIVASDPGAITLPPAASSSPSNLMAGTAAPTPTPGSPTASTPSLSSVLGLPTTANSSNSDANSFTYAAQISELERRSRLLDENNRQLHSQLAQAQQQVQTYRERADLMQQQLGDMSAQLQQARTAATRSLQTNTPPTSNASSPSNTPDPKSSLTNLNLPNPPGYGPAANPKPIDSPRRSSARLSANTSRGTDTIGNASIEPLQALGYLVETNGDAIRVRIPADQIFQPGTSQWTPSAGQLLERVSNALKTASPTGQLLIDSYTDNSSLSTSGLAGADQLTTQQSEAIHSFFVSRAGWNPTSVTKRSNGSDLPIMDNQTPSGRAANRRIEFIISQNR